MRTCPHCKASLLDSVGACSYCKAPLPEVPTNSYCKAPLPEVPTDLEAGQQSDVPQRQSELPHTAALPDAAELLHTARSPNLGTGFPAEIPELTTEVGSLPAPHASAPVPPNHRPAQRRPHESRTREHAHTEALHAPATSVGRGPLLAILLGLLGVVGALAMLTFNSPFGQTLAFRHGLPVGATEIQSELAQPLTALPRLPAKPARARFRSAEPLPGNPRVQLLGYQLPAGVRAHQPHALAIGPDRRPYFDDADGTCVLTVDANGQCTVYAGIPNETGYDDGAAAQARFGRITALAWGPNHTLYVADRKNACVRTIDQNGHVSTVMGGTVPPPAGFQRPELYVPMTSRQDAQINGLHGLGVDASGTLYVFDAASDTVVGRTNQGKLGFLSALAALSPSPVNLAVTPDGLVYLVDYRRSSLWRITDNGRPSELRLNALGPFAIATDAKQRLFIATHEGREIALLTGANTARRVVDLETENRRNNLQPDGGFSAIAAADDALVYGVTDDARLWQLDWPYRP
jgi:hypothetical protein